MPSPIFMEVHHSKQIPQWEVAAPDSANTGPTLPGEREHWPRYEWNAAEER